MALNMSKKRKSSLKRKGDLYYDFGTRNTSFLQTAKDLKINGVENYYFMLALYDPDLEGIDPYAPGIEKNQELCMKIITECVRNPWYFLREVSRIPEPGGSACQFLLNRATCAAIWCFLNGLDMYITIARQIGKTQSIIAIIVWVFLFGSTNTEIMFFHIDQPGSNNNLKRVKAQRELLPSFMQMRFKITDDGKVDKGTDNAQTILNPLNKNTIVTKGKATSKDRADTMGRGATSPVQYFDEFEFITHIKTILQAAGPAYVTSSRNAKKNNSAYGRLFSSTPGDLDSPAGAEAVQVINNMFKWTEKFYNLPIDEIRDIISKGSENQIIYIEYHYTLLGKDQAWFREQCRVLEQDPVKIKRELLLKRIHGSSLSPYTAEDLDAISGMKGRIVEEYIINKLFKIDVYTPLDRNKIYFVGIDPSDGYGGDNSAIVIFDPYELKNVAEFKSPYISHTDLKNLILVLYKKYLPSSLFIIERNKGAALISDLLKTSIRHRLFAETGREMVTTEVMDKRGYLKEDANTRRLTGVWTGTTTRPMMFKLLDAYVREHKEAFVTAGVIDELLTLIRKNDKIAAMPGHHDDHIMAWLMCLYVYYHGMDLYRYGFYKGELPHDTNIAHSNIDYEALEEYEEIKKVWGAQDKSIDDFDKQFRQLVERTRKESSDMFNSISHNTINQSVIHHHYAEGETEDNFGYSTVDMDLFDELNN